MIAEYSGATMEFPAYNMTQMIRHSTPQASSQPCRRPDVPVCQSLQPSRMISSGALQLLRSVDEIWSAVYLGVCPR